jgi:hypothetical protein
MLALLITRQRTGSGALGSILHRHPKLFYTGEILHPDDRNNPHSFFSHLADTPERAAAYADPNTRAALVQSYFAHVTAATAPRMPVLDIKYRSLQHWNPGWQGFFDRPWLIAYARQERMPILHLRRRNYLATYISGRLAEANQVWHTDDAAGLRVRSLHAPPKDVLNFLTICVREAALMTDWLRAHERVLTLDYEDMLDQDGQMRSKIAERTAAFLQIPPFEHRNSAFIKQAPPRLADAIENFDEVATALQGTEFSWMAAA